MPPPTDPHDLNRFLTAQEGIYDTALAELQAGRKQTHWMWFIFPQLDGLGMSPTTKLYAIKSPAEALAYLQHPTLGARLVACTEAVLALQDSSVSQVFGFPDNRKFHSCMTLFDRISDPGSVFARALEQYFGGAWDGKTLAILGKSEFHPHR